MNVTVKARDWVIDDNDRLPLRRLKSGDLLEEMHQRDGGTFSEAQTLGRLTITRDLVAPIH